ncbi:MAG: hypothetical protein CO073_02575 [Candidatus Komeilibacteria bacterium CG_4_9_14_0_8_um_filter_36_9]|uniref:Glycosyltransferase RgtA/B/C/D-like domain-containing protein n=2 Tax=Candidatus Komeiliibacteriota TaxID=1817908 RepID=A0A2M8DR25_9BACT|nr:MAG: hypothetical protein COY67_01120 [Candidatus Komeilibacteria bacterium CG_4_10_14_0_8_um_filter_37_78]PJC01849.1 MAG: hypothetical protein CO073_02575 [Candidatus Komeilibacteria bacterium CG_4_9_14_0_8_um_filter_36_9]
MLNIINKIYQYLFASWWRPLLWIVIIGFLIYTPTLFCDYHYLDDNVLIKDNFYKIANLSYIPQAFLDGAFHDPHGAELYYRPLLTISFIIDAQFGQDSLFFFHLTDILLHLLTACLIYLILIKLKLSQKLAALFTLLFTVHPINLQAIAWLPGRNDPLMAIFIMAGFLFFLHWLESNKYKWYWWFLGFYAISLFTKETAIVFPFLCLAFLFLVKREKLFTKKYWLIGIPYILITIPWLFLRSAMIDSTMSENYNIWQSLSENAPAIIPYIGKIIFPFNLSVFPYLADMPMIYGLIAITGTIALLIYSKKTNWRYVLFGFAWFLLFLLPSFIRPLSSLADFSEHRVYTSLLGFILILWQIRIPIPKNINWKLTSTSISLFIIILFSAINITHAKVYQDKITFWSDAVVNSPSSSFNRNNLGAMYYLDGNYEKALRQWEKTLEINPSEPLTHNNIGLIYEKLGRYAAAEQAYFAELQINPYYDNVHFNLGLLYAKTGNNEQAAQYWHKTIELNPNYFDAYLNLAHYYQLQNNQEMVDQLLEEFVLRGGTLPDSLK